MKTHPWFTIKKVHSHVIAIAEFAHEEKVVSYLLFGKTHAYLIDTGMGQKDISLIVHQLTNLPVIVLLTHSHWDHIGGIASFPTVYVFDNPWERTHLQKTFPKKHFSYLKDKQIIGAGDMTIHVIHTSGHTPGSVCYYVPKHHMLFTGDTVYPGPLYAHLPESDVHAYAASIHQLAHVVSHKKIAVFPGHNSMKVASALICEADKGFSALLQGRLAVSYKMRHTAIYTFKHLSLLVSV